MILIIIIKSIGSVSNLHFQEEKTENTVILLLPESYEYKSRLYLVELFDDTCGKDFTLPANTNKIINCKRDEEDKIDTFWTKEIFYPVITLTSKYKNMRYLFSEYDNNTDYIIHNHFFQPIYLEKTEKDCDIIFKKYSPNFAFFAVGNPFLYNSFYNIFQRLLNNEYGININNYTKLPQVYLRVSSYHLGIIDFFNFYLSQLHIKINVYIRQLYGGTDLYECDGDGDGDGYDIKNLDSFANPISNVKCKNKISLFNRLFNLEGTKFLAGYIAPDSYFDIYAEINDNTSDVINLFPIYGNSICSRNTAKYLKKGVKYKINFDLDHMIKLEPGFDAKIRITNELVNRIIIINPQNPTSPISGNEYTIESKNDAMIYFIEKLPDDYNQKEIDVNLSAGKIIEIIYKEKRESDIIDLGFEKYCPSNTPLIGKIEGIYHYLDNIYDKIKGKLVNGEKLYIYSKNFEHIQEIDYTGKNLNNKNNNFNIFLIPKNDEKNSLVVKTRNKGYNKIIFDLFFCERDTILQIKILHRDKNNNTYLTITNNNFTENVRKYKIDKNSDDYKMLFETDQPVVFTYSYIDSIDEIYEGNDDYKKEREVIRNPKIEEIVRKNGNEIKIKFKPNYKHSSTRYIILIAQKNSENTIEKFKDPCFVTGLLNQRPNGVKVEAIYDGGIDDSINAEVDISDILNEKNSYLMSIISQELRFFKKINFYEPKEFGNEEDSSILVIVLPIVGAIIIVIVAIVVFFIIRRKHNKQDDVPENFDAVSKLSKLSDKSFQF